MLKSMSKQANKTNDSWSSKKLLVCLVEGLKPKINVFPHVLHIFHSVPFHQQDTKSHNDKIEKPVILTLAATIF